MIRTSDQQRASVSIAQRTAAVATAVAAALALSACSGGGGDSEPKVNEQGTYLFASVPDYYFSTIDVGTARSQEIEVQNRGADRYPLNEITVRGEHADHFRVPIFGEITLEPAQAIRVPVTFAPFDEGRKLAALEIDYETIVQVDEATNQLEQTYYEAEDLGRNGDYRAAQRGFEDYLAGNPVTDNRQRAAVRVPIVQEAELYGQGADATLYLDALTARDRANPEAALLSVDTLLLTEPDSYLADDAQYLKGYIALMDLDDPRTALREFRELTERFPDSTYYDTALYGEAIAQERLGNDRLAIELYGALRERHTSVDTLGVRLPKDELVSRLWFGRADSALQALGAG